MPRLRFPGFKGEWSEIGFGKLFAIIPNNTLSRADLSEVGEIKNIHYGDVLIKYGDTLDVQNTNIPYIADSTQIKRKDVFLENGDVIIADTAEDETVGKATEIYNNSKSYSIVSGLHTIPCRPRFKFASKFLGFYLNTPHYHKQLLTIMQGIKVLSISKSNICNTIIRYPNIYEQVKITKMLSLIDQRITKQQELVENLKSYKRGVLSAIFGRKIRFKKIRAEKYPEWQIVKLSDLFSKIFTRNTDNAISNVITNSAEYGLLPQIDFFDKEIANAENTSGYYVIQRNYFVYNPRKSNSAPYGPFNRYTFEETGIISPLYTVLRLKKPCNSEYLSWYFKSSSWYRYIYDNGSQGARHDRVSMTDDLLFGVPVYLPCNDEQEKISCFLLSLNNYIELNVHSLDNLNKIKEEVLHKMFI